MIWLRIIIVLFVALMLIYYSMLILHIAGIIKFTSRKITISRAICPFYYWIKPTTENKPNNPQKPTNHV